MVVLQHDLSRTSAYGFFFLKRWSGVHILTAIQRFIYIYNIYLFILMCLAILVLIHWLVMWLSHSKRGLHHRIRRHINTYLNFSRHMHWYILLSISTKNIERFHRKRLITQATQTSSKLNRYIISVLSGSGQRATEICTNAICLLVNTYTTNIRMDFISLWVNLQWAQNSHVSQMMSH